MSGQRAPARPALLGPSSRGFLVPLVVRRFAGRDRLFDVLQHQGELVRIELLGFAPELHSLKLAQKMREAIVLPERRVALDDRGVPLRERRSQPHTKRVDVEQGADSRRSRLQGDQICSRLWREISRFAQASRRRLRRCNVARVKTRPVQTVHERGQLRGRQTHNAVADRRPAKCPLLESFPVQNQAGAIPCQNLQPVRPLRAKDEDRPRERIALKLVLRQRRQAVGAASEVDRLRRHKNPNASRNRDHVAAFTARSTFVSIARSVPGPTSAISIVPLAVGQRGPA